MHPKANATTGNLWRPSPIALATILMSMLFAGCNEATDGASTVASDGASLSTIFGFAPAMRSNCWAYPFVVNPPTNPWIGGNGNCPSATAPRYTVNVPVEDMSGKPYPTSGLGGYPHPYEAWIPGFFSYEERSTLGSNTAAFRMRPNLMNFNFVPRSDDPNTYYFNAVLDKINATGLSADEKGTSIGMFFTEDFGQNNRVSNGAFPLPDLGRNAKGAGLHVNVAFQLHDAMVKNSALKATVCNTYSGDAVTGHCTKSTKTTIGAGSARALVGIAIAAAGKTYWIDFVIWQKGPNLFAPYDQGRNPDRFPNPEIVLKRGPDSASFEQVYIDANQLGAGKRLSPGLPPCPALTYGVQNAQPGRAGDPWYSYGIDVTSLAACIPWTTPITNLAGAQLIQVAPAVVVNGVARVYWATRDLLTFKP